MKRIYLKTLYKSSAIYEAQFLKWEEGVTSREMSGRALKGITAPSVVWFKYTIDETPKCIAANEVSRTDGVR